MNNQVNNAVLIFVTKFKGQITREKFSNHLVGKLN
jgi:hypothetical protein